MMIEAPLFDGPVPAWYHGRVPRDVCEPLMLQHGTFGCFLVRASDRTVVCMYVRVHVYV